MMILLFSMIVFTYNTSEHHEFGLHNIDLPGRHTAQIYNEISDYEALAIALKALLKEQNSLIEKV